MSYPRNAATPPIVAVGAIYLLADGTIQTTGASVRVKTGTGSWGSGAGTLACDSTSGIWTYAPTQAETDAESFVVGVYKASSTSAQVTVATSASATAGYSGVDWSKLTAATTTVNLSGTTISTTQQVASVSGSVGSISGITFPTNFSTLGINGSGHVSRVTLVDTTTTNTDMRGTDGAALASAWTATRAAYLDSVILAANSNQRTVQITGSQHIAADVHEMQTDVFDADAIAADAVTELQAGLATAANLLIVSDRVSYSLAVLVGACSDAQTAAETYTLSIGGNTFTVDYTGLDSSGNRSTTTLSKT